MHRRPDPAVTGYAVVGHLAFDPRRHRQRHDQLEEQCSFFAKK
jgi:hypothetical protein